MKKITISGRDIGAGIPPFIVAEMSGNHNHSLERALRIVEAVAQAGADALKIQTYTADTITLDHDQAEFFIRDAHSLWNGNSLHQLYRQAYTPWEWHEPIFERCQELGLICFSTPFDETAVDFLESLRVPCYKIASFENVHLPLIKKTAATGKPIIISSGMASIAELDEALGAIREQGNNDVVLLKCTSTYPASPADSNLATIPHLRDLFQCQVGLSDHTLGIGVAIAGVALGATVIEKHVTLARADGGVDAAFSLEPPELAVLVTETRRAWESMGEIKYGPTEQEKDSIKLRRSIYIAADIKTGEPLTAQNMRIIRPGFGLPPKYYEMLLGKRVNRDLPKGTALSWECLLD